MARAVVLARNAFMHLAFSVARRKRIAALGSPTRQMEHEVDVSSAAQMRQALENLAKVENRLYDLEKL